MDSLLINGCSILVESLVRYQPKVYRALQDSLDSVTNRLKGTGQPFSLSISHPSETESIVCYEIPTHFNLMQRNVCHRRTLRYVTKVTTKCIFRNI